MNPQVSFKCNLHVLVWNHSERQLIVCWIRLDNGLHQHVLLKLSNRNLMLLLLSRNPVVWA